MSRFSFFRWGKSKSDADNPSDSDGQFVADSVDRKQVSGQNSSNDPHLPEKKRARRRLVGSVTLVLAAIIVLPMVFESKPKQSVPDLVIDIPSKDKSLQTVGNNPVTAPVADTANAPQSGQPVEQPASAGIAPAPQPGQSVPPTEAVVKEDTAVVQEKPVAVQTQAKQEQQKAAEKQALAEKEKQLKAEKARQEKAKANENADPIGKMIADKTAANSEKQMVQVAALTSQQKVNELQARLTKAGIRSHTQKVKAKNGEEWIRVRVGPLSGKSEVDSMCSRLKGLGLSCTLVPN